MGAKMGGKSSRARRGGRGNFDDINMTPFIDVMLVLLIVFMVAAPMMTSGVTVDLPKTKSSSLPGNDEPLNVSIKSDGTIFVQNTEVKLEELGAKIEAIAGEKKETRIFVRGDTAIDYGQVMRAIGEINAAGFSKVALLTDTATVAPKR